MDFGIGNKILLLDQVNATHSASSSKSDPGSGDRFSGVMAMVRKRLKGQGPADGGNTLPLPEVILIPISPTLNIISTDAVIGSKELAQFASGRGCDPAAIDLLLAGPGQSIPGLAPTQPNSAFDGTPASGSNGAGGSPSEPSARTGIVDGLAALLSHAATQAGVRDAAGIAATGVAASDRAMSGGAGSADSPSAQLSFAAAHQRVGSVRGEAPPAADAVGIEADLVASGDTEAGKQAGLSADRTTEAQRLAMALRSMTGSPSGQARVSDPAAAKLVNDAVAVANGDAVALVVPDSKTTSGFRWRVQSMTVQGDGQTVASESGAASREASGRLDIVTAIEHRLAEDIARSVPQAAGLRSIANAKNSIPQSAELVSADVSAPAAPAGDNAVPVPAQSSHHLTVPSGLEPAAGVKSSANLESPGGNSAMPAAGADLAGRFDAYSSLENRLAVAMGQQITSQVARGVWAMNFRLHPVELGQVDVTLGMSDGKLAALFSSSATNTQQLIEQGFDRLRAVLQDAGFAVGSLGIDSSGSGTQGGRRSPQDYGADALAGLSGRKRGAAERVSDATPVAGAVGQSVGVVDLFV